MDRSSSWQLLQSFTVSSFPGPSANCAHPIAAKVVRTKASRPPNATYFSHFRIELVGRVPRPAPGALARLVEVLTRSEWPARGPAADAGVRPTQYEALSRPPNAPYFSHFRIELVGRVPRPAPDALARLVEVLTISEWLARGPAADAGV